MGLRERKKERTRAALVDAAARLFAERGYEKTTVADIAAAAEVSTRTFFAYFPAKEDVLFAGTDERLRALSEAFDAVRGGSPREALRRILERVLAASDDLSSPDRMALMLTKPELQAQALHRLVAAHRLIAGWLRRSFPERLDGPLSRAMAGAVVGALVGTVLGGTVLGGTGLGGTVLGDTEHGDPPPDLRAQLHRALTLLEDGLRTLD